MAGITVGACSATGALLPQAPPRRGSHGPQPCWSPAALFPRPPSYCSSASRVRSDRVADDVDDEAPLRGGALMLACHCQGLETAVELSYSLDS